MPISHDHSLPILQALEQLSEEALGSTQELRCRNAPLTIPSAPCSSNGSLSGSGAVVVFLSGLGSGEAPNPEFLGGDK